MVALQALWSLAATVLALSVCRGAIRTWGMPQVAKDRKERFFQWWFRRYWTFMRVLWATAYLASGALVWVAWKPAILYLLVVPASLLLSIPMTWLVMGGLYRYHFDPEGNERRPNPDT